MKSAKIQYLVGALMVSFSMYQVYRGELWEFSLYAVAGSAFITMGLIKEDRYPEYARLLHILSWILILVAAFLFFFLVRTDE